jgi:Flp pilus assembly protein TadG
MIQRLSGLSKDRRGAALIEFAIVLPAFACLLFGVMAYGQYFLLAHSVQQIANDAARATVAGLSAAERQALATSATSADLAALSQIDPRLVTTTVAETSDTVTVNVRLDASNMALFRTPLVPLPSAQIERRAVVRPGGIT